MSKKNKNIIERFLEFFSQLIYAFSFYVQEVKENIFGGRKKSDKKGKTKNEVKKTTTTSSSGAKKKVTSTSKSNSSKQEQRVRQVDIEDILEAIQEEQRQQEKMKNISNIYEIHSQTKPKSHITDISLEEIRKKRENEREKLERESKKTESIHKAEIPKAKTEIEKRIEKKEEQKKEKAKTGWLKNQIKNIEELRKKREQEQKQKKEETLKNDLAQKELDQQNIGDNVQKIEESTDKIVPTSVKETPIIKKEKSLEGEDKQLEELKKKQEEQLAFIRQKQQEQKMKEQQKAEFDELRRKQQEQNRLQAEERKKKEQEQLAEKIKRQQRLEEIQRKEQGEIEALKREKEKAELELRKIRQQEEEQLEILRRKQQEKEQLESLRKAKEEKERQEKLKLAQEEARRQEEQRLAQEEARRQEEQRLAREEARRQEEQRLAQEEVRRQEEQRLAQEEVRRQEEQRLAQEEARRQEELRLEREENARQEALRLEREKKEQQEAARLAREARQEQESVVEEEPQAGMSQEIDSIEEEQEQKNTDAQILKKRDFRWIRNGAAAAIFVIALIMGGNVFGKKIASVVDTESMVEAVSEEDENSTVSQEEGSVTLSFVGDLMCHMPQFRDAYDVKTGEYNFSKCFSQVDQYLQESDLTIGNLETVFAGDDQKYSGYPTFNTPDDFARTLKEVGFDILTTANNHSFDRGETGVVRTLDVLDEVRIDHIGTYRNAQEKQNIVVKEVNGIKFAFVSFTVFTNQSADNEADHINYLTQEEVNSQMQLAKAQNPDCIVAMPHWGEEYETVPNDSQKEMSDMLIEAGADIIIGSHPHVVQKMGKKKVTGEDGNTREVFVAYSLGNFTSNQNSEYTRDEVILNLTVRKGANGIYIEKIGYRPVYMNKEGTGVNTKNFQLIDTITYKREFTQSDDEEAQNLYNTVLGSEEHIKMLLRGEAPEDENAKEIESSASETETTAVQSSTSLGSTNTSDSESTTQLSSATASTTSSAETTTAVTTALSTTAQTGTTASTALTTD